MDSGQDSVPAGADRFGFERIEAMLRSAPEAPGEKAGRWERGLFLLGVAAAAAAVLSGAVASGRVGVLLVLACILIECSALAVSAVLSLRRHWRSFRHPTRDFAHELDADFVHYRACVAELRRFPIAELDAHLRYLRARRRSMQHGLSLFTGGLERLGILPLIGVLYLQFKDWRWGDWARLTEVSPVQALLAGALLLVYASGWHLAVLYRRSATYDALLAEAVHAQGFGAASR